jgi:hypothetical protein
VEHWADELRAEERRIVMTGVWAGITLFFGAMTVLLSIALALLLLPAHLRILGLAIFAGLSLIASVVLALCLRRQLARPAHLPATASIAFASQILASVLRLAHHKSFPKRAS